ncbi:MAG: ribonuclease Y [Candidatus Bipolaricaulota bacterium]|nr:ribonuclease Y [Candidatus Bipolaricaulota bacterium]MDW8152011.1 ribonuclease Y [Candidatus Bipolaricaulota bacterium]
MHEALLFALVAVLAFLAGLALPLLRGHFRRRALQAQIEEAKREAERLRQEALLSAQKEIQEMRAREEQRLRRWEAELTQLEERLRQREDRLGKKSHYLEMVEDALRRDEAELERLIEMGQKLLAEERELLERLSGFTQEEAKEYLLKLVEAESERYFAKKIAEVERRTRQEAERRARRILADALQRLALDYVEEATVTAVPLPSEEYKGRIIGRDGRNIRTFEALTGVEVLVDDTPEVVVLSSFHPIRREVARLALERLLEDGRIHPARIEEMVRKAKDQVEAVIREQGEKAAMEVGVELPDELIQLLGRLHFRQSYGQNQLRHAVEVSFIARMLAEELGIDPRPAKRAGLLHDIGKALDHEVEGPHALIGADLVKRYGEPWPIVNAIAAHHGQVEPATITAVLIQAADALSAARPGARVETYERYIQRLADLEKLARAYPQVKEAYALQAGREVRVILRPEKTTDEMAAKLAYDIARRIEEELQYPGEIKVTVIRQTQYTETAR